MAKIPNVFPKDGDSGRKPSGDGANGSPTGPNQPGGSAAGQPAPFLQNRRNQIVAAVLLLGELLILPLFGMGQSATNEKPLSDVLAALPSGQFSGHPITRATIDDDNRVLQLALDTGRDVQISLRLICTPGRVMLLSNSAAKSR